MHPRLLLKSESCFDDDDGANDLDKDSSIFIG